MSSDDDDDIEKPAGGYVTRLTADQRRATVLEELSADDDDGIVKILGKAGKRTQPALPLPSTKKPVRVVARSSPSSNRQATGASSSRPANVPGALARDARSMRLTPARPAMRDFTLRRAEEMKSSEKRRSMEDLDLCKTGLPHFLALCARWLTCGLQLSRKSPDTGKNLAEEVVAVCIAFDMSKAPGPPF